jgi:hypothetical protein
MPPQQAHHLLDFGDCFFGFCAHFSSGLSLPFM